MYRLMLYYLILLWVISLVLSATGLIPYHPIDILLQGLTFLIVCHFTNLLFAKIFQASTNLESSLITALILTLIVGPISFPQNTLTIFLIGTIAMASKYLVAAKKKHLFNPAAFAVLISAFLLNTGASWWIGIPPLLPFILLGGLIILIKIKRFELVLSFITLTVIGNLLTQGHLDPTLLPPALWFFALVMLVEPLTSPSTKRPQIIFGFSVALFTLLIPKVYSTYPYPLETALLLGNLFTAIVSPTFNLILKFRKKELVAENSWALFFEPLGNINFTPGQYLEWTYPHPHPDSRGVRRYFTISSSPQEPLIMVTLKLPPSPSTFKQALLNLKEGQEIVASSPKGDFTLPQDTTIPLCFIAGGIGVTPFRSMLKDLLDRQEKRPITLLYSNSNETEVAFKPLFDEVKKLGVITIFVNTKQDGYIDTHMIQEKVPHYRQTLFYISGPEPMVQTFKKMLQGLKVTGIKTDFFPGYTDTHQKGKL
ncbi:MAG: RnfABCDGE type electron transport complex subunit D [Candidatus Chisholmbacteria bacterium]|nr:RnfABCDGE type electron transport complex subunit D [Candidatus Chisholmbacteria bacterium]